MARTLETTILWGDTILDRLHLFEDRVLQLRELRVEVDLSPKLELAEKRGDSALIRIPQEALAHLQCGELVTPVQEATAILELGQTLLFSLGNLCFVFRMNHTDVRLDPAPRPDWAYPRTLALSATAHAFFVASSLLTPTARSFDADLFQRRPSYIKDVRFKKPPPQPEPQGKLDVGRYRRKEGLIGKPNRPKSAKKIDPRRAGLLGQLAELREGSAVGNLLSADSGSGINAALDGLVGQNTFADAGGAGGMATRGSGVGGGGGSIGIGGLRMGGGGLAGDPGGTGVTLGSQRRQVQLPPEGRDIKGDGLTRDEVQRVIRRALPRIKFCYEKELQSLQDFSGKINPRFTIAPTGKVAQVSIVESTLRHPRAEACVVGVLESLVFPKPRGGGVVVVSYPFIFCST